MRMQAAQLRRNFLGQRHAVDPVRLQGRQHLGGKAADLLHEHLVRQYPAVEADLHGVGARTLGCVDDAPGHLIRGTPWHVLGLALDIGHRQPAKILAGKLCGAQILGG